MTEDYYFKLYQVLEDFKLTKKRSLKKVVRKMTDKDCKQIAEEWRAVYKSLDNEKLYERDDKEKVLRYYPSSRFQMDIDSNVLNRFLLYADKLVLTDPFSTLIAGTVFAGGEDIYYQTNVPKFLSYKPLFENGIGELIPHQMHYTYSNKSMIGREISSDIMDNEYFAICNQYLDVETEIDQDITHFDGDSTVWAGSIDFEKRKGESFIRTKEPRIDPPPERKEEATKRAIRQKTIEINFDLLLAQQMSAHYMSPSEMTFRLLENKSKRRSGLSEMVDAKFLPSLLKLNLPALLQIHPEKVIDIRNKLNDEFMDFRLVLKESLARVNAIPYSSEFEKEVSAIQQEEIDPNLRELKRDVKRLRTHRSMRAMGSAIFTSIPLIGSIFANDIYQVISWAASSGLTVNTLNELVEMWKEQDEVKKNSWYFLWELNK